MLNEKDNRTVTQVGPGTPMGELMRRFWIPALLSDEVPVADGPPVRMRLLGEDLLAFRDTEGRVGIVEAYCAHRRAPLYFGRNEECGLRCVYHGWKYDVTGQCVDMPNEPAESTFKEKIKLRAYPTQEAHGLVWAYLGPREQQAELPRMDWMQVPDSHRMLVTGLHESNWLQGLEGEIDTSHVSFLHRYFSRDQRNLGFNAAYMEEDTRPQLTVQETPYGFVYGSRRAVEEGYYWRLTQWLVPFWTMIPGRAPNSVRAWVPIDDHHTKIVAIVYAPDRTLDHRDFDSVRAGQRGFSRTEPCAFRLPDGYVIDTQRPLLNPDNDYGISREHQRLYSFSGIPGGAPDEDRAMTVGMRPVVERSSEHLGTADIAIIAARRRLLRLTSELAAGEEPYAPTHGSIYGVRAVELTSREADFARLLEADSLRHSGVLTPAAR